MTKMLFALVTLCVLLLNIDATTKKPEGRRKVPKELYEEFFALIVKGLIWNATMAWQADQQLKERECFPQYLEVLLERNFGYPFKTGEHILLTLELLFTKVKLLRKVRNLHPGTKFGCNYEYKFEEGSYDVTVRVLCFFTRRRKSVA